MATKRRKALSREESIIALNEVISETKMELNERVSLPEVSSRDWVRCVFMKMVVSEDDPRDFSPRIEDYIAYQICPKLMAKGLKPSYHPESVFDEFFQFNLVKGEEGSTAYVDNEFFRIYLILDKHIEGTVHFTISEKD